MPKNEELRVEIIWLHHDILIVEYEGKQKKMELVIRNYWWLGMTKNVGRYIEKCDMCQRIKNRTEVPVEKLKLSEVLEKPQTHLMVNFITKLPLVARKDTILVICNRLSKMTHFVAIMKEASAEGLARLFRDNIQKLYGLLKSIVLDRGLQFVAEIIRELNSMLEIKTKLSTSFHSQTDR